LRVCPNSRAAARPMPAKNAGTSIMVTCTRGRSGSALAFPSTKLHGAGLAASIPAVIRWNARTDQPQLSTRRAPASRPDRACFWRSGRKPIFRLGATHGIGPQANTQCLGRRREVAVAEPSSLMTCPCGEVFDSHHPEQTLIHVPHIAARQTRNECQSFALNRYDR
jgi:hypothetical protein